MNVYELQPYLKNPYFLLSPPGTCKPSRRRNRGPVSPRASTPASAPKRPCPGAARARDPPRRRPPPSGPPPPSGAPNRRRAARSRPPRGRRRRRPPRGRRRPRALGSARVV